MCGLCTTLHVAGHFSPDLSPQYTRGLGVRLGDARQRQGVFDEEV
jgi:hypothetical protein